MAGRPKAREGRYERISLEVREDLLEWLDSHAASRRELIEEALIAKKEDEEMNTVTIPFEQTLENFLQSEDFKSGVISSTKASWSGSNYKLELFPAGDWRVLWSNEIGNLYETEGKILTLPALDTDEMDEYVNGGAGSQEEYLSEAFYAEESELQAEMREALSKTETA